MKAFSRVLGSVALVFVIFFLIGVFIDHVDYRIEMTIDSPPDKVFNALTDRDLQLEWIHGLQESVLVEGNEVAVGSVYSVVVLDGTKTVQFTEKIERSEPDSILEYSINSKGMDGYVMIECKIQGTKTLLTVNTELTGTVWFVRSLLPLIKQSLYEKNLKDYEKFASLLGTL